jgi:hypothetical protein
MTTIEWLQRLGIMPSALGSMFEGGTAAPTGGVPPAMPGADAGFTPADTSMFPGMGSTMGGDFTPATSTISGIEPTTPGAEGSFTPTGDGTDGAGGGGMGGRLVQAGIQALQGVMGSKDLGLDIREQFAKDYGITDTSKLPDTPDWLKKGRQREAEAGIAAANLIPVVGQFISAGLRGFDTMRDQRTAINYFGRLFNSVPELRKTGMENPADAAMPSQTELVGQGLRVGQRALLGPIAPLAEKAEKAVEYIPQTAGKLWDKGMKLPTPLKAAAAVLAPALGVGKLLSKFPGIRNTERLEKERQQRIEEMVKRNKKKFKQYKADVEDTPTSLSTLAQAYSQDPATAWVLRLMAQQPQSAPKYEKVQNG